MQSCQDALKHKPPSQIAVLLPYQWICLLNLIEIASHIAHEMPVTLLRCPRFRPLPGLAALFAVLALACGDSDTANGGLSDQLDVVVTTTQIGDFATEVGGELISLTVLLKPNQDAHDFEAEPGDLRALAAADLVLTNGLDLDSFVSKAIGQSKAPMVAVTSGISLRRSPADSEGLPDPHVWHSVKNAILMVENIRDALSEADPRNAMAYEENASRYVGRLAALDEEIKAAVMQLRPACRKLITNHDVFGYFTDAYGFEFVASLISSTSPAAQASAADVADLVGKIRESRVPAIFSEASANSGLIKQAAREAKVLLVDDLYGDSLGPADSDGATYIGMMRWNTARIVEALTPCGD